MNYFQKTGTLTGEQRNVMKIEILGAGCSNCRELYENVEQALEEAGRDARVIKVEDITKIIEYGVMMPPALVIDGEVKSAGRVISPEEIKRFFT